MIWAILHSCCFKNSEKSSTMLLGIWWHNITQWYIDIVEYNCKEMTHSFSRSTYPSQVLYNALIIWWIINLTLVRVTLNTNAGKPVALISGSNWNLECWWTKYGYNQTEHLPIIIFSQFIDSTRQSCHKNSNGWQTWFPSCKFSCLL